MSALENSGTIQNEYLLSFAERIEERSMGLERQLKPITVYLVSHKAGSGSIQEKKQKKQMEVKTPTAVNGLTGVAMRVQFKFRETVDELELMDFKHFLKKRNAGRVDNIVTIQDCKIVAIFLCVQQLPQFFHKFFNLPTVNQVLRACIVYMQFYLQTCETLVKTQHYLRGNPLPSGKTPSYDALKEDLDDLRALIGQHVAGMVATEKKYNQLNEIDNIMLFECFVKVTIMVVWIALERKYLDVIRIEVGRIFRSHHFNPVTKNEPDNILSQIHKENKVILEGKMGIRDRKKLKTRTRLQANSPTIDNFTRVDDPRMSMLERNSFEFLRDQRLRFFTNYIFTPETEIRPAGISLGILGYPRRLFDPLLHPCSKRILKLLITGSPMDISEDRKDLRVAALKKSQRESEPVSPHIFDELPKIPRPGLLYPEQSPTETQIRLKESFQLQKQISENFLEKQNQFESNEEEDDEYEFEEDEEDEFDTEEYRGGSFKFY